MSEHGVSMITFLNKIIGQEETLLICEDEDGFKFGAVCFEEWV